MTHVPPEEPAGPARIRPFLGVSGLGSTPADGTPAGLRPFVLTSGRVDGVDPDIGLETQVTARSDGPLRTGVPVSSLAPELRTIMALCAEPISVAEISARARLHLGVTRILVGDLRAAGYLDVHAREAARPDPDTILRVIRGLRAIS
ncbi:DUF742 domain-containing protein [Phytohabitans sp. ZYX-F-186]|uniref:DUF742 domain-containing protein n=1 Tax=Phytohabitans maris TaxID=3071409 RepID=A0ABU0ZJJ4_9ACTN|nr:DUF742 domain-containing protein [Phytohabitans sp. ZYX-F-186]MDQ7907219.1 DUF742 domain-containing protein [Phytohabitans sp. ZYX-F-186]